MIFPSCPTHGVLALTFTKIDDAGNENIMDFRSLRDWVPEHRVTGASVACGLCREPLGAVTVWVRQPSTLENGTHAAKTPSETTVSATSVFALFRRNFEKAISPRNGQQMVCNNSKSPKSALKKSCFNGDAATTSPMNGGNKKAKMNERGAKQQADESVQGSGVVYGGGSFFTYCCSPCHQKGHSSKETISPTAKSVLPAQQHQKDLLSARGTGNAVLTNGSTGGNANSVVGSGGGANNGGHGSSADNGAGAGDNPASPLNGSPKNSTVGKRRKQNDYT